MAVVPITYLKANVTFLALIFNTECATFLARDLIMGRHICRVKMSTVAQFIKANAFKTPVHQSENLKRMLLKRKPTTEQDIGAIWKIVLSYIFCGWKGFGKAR